MDWVGPSREGTSSVSKILGIHTLSTDSSWALQLFRPGPHKVLQEGFPWTCCFFYRLMDKCYSMCSMCSTALCIWISTMLGYISMHIMFLFPCWRLRKYQPERCQLDILFRKASVLSNLQSLSSVHIFAMIADRFPSAVRWRQRMHLPQCRPCTSWLLQAQQDKIMCLVLHRCRRQAWCSNRSIHYATIIPTCAKICPDMPSLSRENRE